MPTDNIKEIMDGDIFMQDQEGNIKKIAEMTQFENGVTDEKDDAIDAMKYMRKTNGKLAKIDEDYGWEIRKRLTSENWDYMIEEMKKLFYIALAKANIPLSDISITEYEDSKLHKVDRWERKDDKDPKSEHVTITKHYKYLLCYQQYCTFANNEFELYAKGIDLILNPNGYWYPKFSMKNMSFHISTEEYELKRKIDNLEIEKKVYIDDKNK